MIEELAIIPFHSIPTNQERCHFELFRVNVSDPPAVGGEILSVPPSESLGGTFNTHGENVIGLIGGQKVDIGQQMVSGGSNVEYAQI